MRKSLKIIMIFGLIVILYLPSNAFAIVYQPPILFQKTTPVASDEFGDSVAIDGNNILVGNPNDDTGASNAGAAQLFDRTTGVLLQTFQKTTPVTGDQFGFSVDISGNNVLVGALNDDTGATDAGAAYLFDATTGALLLTFENPTPVTSDLFSWSVAIDGNNVVVGALRDDTGANNAGAAYLFDITTCDADTSNGGTAGDFTCEAATQTLQKTTPVADDEFGISVDISGNNVVVGARFDDTGASNAGAAFLFDATTGGLLLTFENPTPLADDRFGNFVAISGNNVVAGAHLDNTGAGDAGAAYVFNTTTCDADTSNGGSAGDFTCEAATQTLQKTTPVANDNFGIFVDISGNNVVVGVLKDDTGATDAGAAYLFDATTGGLLLAFENPTPATNDDFGKSLAIDGNYVLVGAHLDDTGASNAGAAYLFNTTTCDADTSNGGSAGDFTCEAATQTLQKTTPVAGDEFGRAVSISGSNVVVGAPFHDTGTSDSGAAYLFDATTDSLLQIFLNPSPSVAAGFGVSVDISGNNVVVGARFDDTGATNGGAAYLFDATTGGLLQTLQKTTPAVNDEFGNSVAIDGNNIVVGAEFDDTSNTDTGAAYLFDATTGNLLLTFLKPTPLAGDRFGEFVEIVGNNVLVAAANDDGGATNAGAVFLYDITTCDADTSNGGSAGDNICEADTQRFLNPTPATNDFFGGSIGIDGNKVVVGATNDDTGATDAGAVYVFDATTGGLLQTIQKTTPVAGDLFGRSIAIFGNNIMIGAPRDDTGATDAGSAFLFDTSGNLLYTFPNPTPEVNDEFSRYADMSGNSVIIGTALDDTGGIDAGAAYLFLENVQNQVQGQVTIGLTCGISLPSGNTIDFSEVIPGAISTQQTLTVFNTGNANGELLVSGTDWLDGGAQNIINVENTRFSDATGDYNSKTPLSKTPAQTIVNPAPPQQNSITYWQVQANVNNPTFTGLVTQTMDLTINC